MNKEFMKQEALKRLDILTETLNLNPNIKKYYRQTYIINSRGVSCRHDRNRLLHTEEHVGKQMVAFIQRKIQHLLQRFVSIYRRFSRKRERQQGQLH